MLRPERSVSPCLAKNASPEKEQEEKKEYSNKKGQIRWRLFQPGTCHCKRAYLWCGVVVEKRVRGGGVRLTSHSNVSKGHIGKGRKETSPPSKEPKMERPALSLEDLEGEEEGGKFHSKPVFSQNFLRTVSQEGPVLRRGGSKHELSFGKTLLGS